MNFLSNAYIDEDMLPPYCPARDTVRRAETLVGKALAKWGYKTPQDLPEKSMQIDIDAESVVVLWRKGENWGADLHPAECGGADMERWYRLNVF